MYREPRFSNSPTSLRQSDARNQSFSDREVHVYENVHENV